MLVRLRDERKGSAMRVATTMIPRRSSHNHAGPVHRVIARRLIAALAVFLDGGASVIPYS
jgi:hypothetical protein